MAWFRCYDNSDVIATLIMTNFHLLWWQFFLMFVYGDVVYAQTWHWPWKTVSSHLQTPVRPMLLQYGLVSFRLFCKNLGHLREFFGQMVSRPPGKKFPVRLCLLQVVIGLASTVSINTTPWRDHCVSRVHNYCMRLLHPNWENVP